MTTRIKFCGLVRPSDVTAAVALGVDAIGFVFYENSPRYVDIQLAAQLRRLLPSFVSAVGLFVNADFAAIQSTQLRVGLDVIQLHGDESPEFAQMVGEQTARPWWRAVRCRDQADLVHSKLAYSAAQAWLIDSYSPQFGGTGKTFDWTLLKTAGFDANRLIMSGGLDASNVAMAIAGFRPRAVDVSSGVQLLDGALTDPRQKCVRRMEQFVEAVRSADRV